MNTDLRKKAKNIFEPFFFGKNVKNVRKHRDIKFVTTEKQKKLFGVRNQIFILQCFSHKIYYL